MKRHQVQLPTLGVVSQLPNIARTRAGNEFDPTLSRWKIRGDVDVLNINFDALPPVSGVPPSSRTLSIGMMFLSEVLHGT
jgi:hypothetical protein